MLHESPDREPETIWQCEVVLIDEPVLVHARVGDGPLVGREPGHDPDGHGHEDVGEQDVHPDLKGEWVHEREQLEMSWEYYVYEKQTRKI